MPRKPTKKTTKRAKKPLMESLATSTALVEPGLRPMSLFAEAPKPAPQNVADAWDAMKVAHDAPMWIRHQTVNPYRAEQDKRDLLASTRRKHTS